MFAYAGDLPAISALDNYSPSTITRVRASDGTVIGEFAVERRLVISYDDIPANFRQAIIAAEDAGFDSHFGVSISAIAFRASRDIFDAAKAVVTGRGGRPAGASTLTQQLARNLFAEASASAPAKSPTRMGRPRTEDQRGDRRRPDREAVHEARDPDALRQPDAVRAWHVRRRGRRSTLFRQVGKRADTRRGGAARRHRAAARRARAPT